MHDARGWLFALVPVPPGQVPHWRLAVEEPALDWYCVGAEQVAHVVHELWSDVLVNVPAAQLVHTRLLVAEPAELT